MLQWTYFAGSAYLTFLGKTFAATSIKGDHPSGFVSVKFINEKMHKICRHCKFCCKKTPFRSVVGFRMTIRAARLLYAVSAFEEG